MIKVNNLTQIYKSGRGIFDVSFEVREGEVFGYLGPNGAGKTTTIRNLLGFTNATRGNAEINGMDCRKHAAELQNITGYIPGEMTFLDNMTGIEFLKFMTDMRRTKDVSMRNKLIEMLELDTKVKIKKMSKGMKQKLGIITAFMHDPAVYILDEPTSGLDPFMQNVFMDLIESEKNRGKTILMSSHIFEEVQRSCSRAAIIKEGRLAAVEDIQSLNAMKQRTYIVTLANSDDAARIMNTGLSCDKISEKQVQVSVSHNYRELFEILSTCDIVGFHSKQQTLEDVFMKYYGKDGESNE